MRRRGIRILGGPKGTWFPGLMAVSLCFALGALGGYLLAAQAAGSGAEGLDAYLRSYVEAVKAQETVPPGLFSVLWETLRWPLLTFLMSFTALGVVGIPVLFAIRGFLLSFAVASFFRILGGAGGVLAFAAFGMTGLLALPALFVLGVQGFTTAGVLAGRGLGAGKGPLPFGRLFLLRCGGCAAALGLCTLMEYLLIPTLVSGAARLF